MEKETKMREELTALLKGGNAHNKITEYFETFPKELINTKIKGIVYSPWQLFEHIRIAQWDILEFVKNPNHISPDWPEGYWPARDKLADDKMWEETYQKFISDLNEVLELAQNEELDLNSELPHASGYTYLREILLVADHNAYHVGQLMMMRKVLESD